MINTQSFLELPFSFDIEKLKDDLYIVEEDEWMPHPNTLAYDGIWEVSSLTSTDGDTKNIIAIENENYIATPLLNKTKYIQSVIDTFKTKVEAVRFMKLGAFSSIKEHCDKGSCFEDGYARLHIPIISNDNVEFILSGKNYKMDLGRCYYIDAHNIHSVVNKGNNDRIHLLIDCQVNDWLKDFFLKKGFEEPKYKYGEKSITDDNVEQIIESFKTIGTDVSLEMANKLQKIKMKKS
ncbi:aspartyl/asparaginyl beta-hydroxylase domain-containing protein [Campylobacterota bacterium DY0563]